MKRRGGWVLPKQGELERVVQILFEEFDDPRSLATQDWKKKKKKKEKKGRNGSYARGGWVDEPHTAKDVIDFDLLIIVNDKHLTDRVEYWTKAEERSNRELSIAKALKTPVNFIVHTLHEVNEGLAHGRFFFMDAIYQSDGSELAEPKPKTPDEALAMAKEYFEEWFSAAAGAREQAVIARTQDGSSAYQPHRPGSSATGSNCHPSRGSAQSRTPPQAPGPSPLYLPRERHP
jgi:hypothetical protein